MYKSTILPPHVVLHSKMYKRTILPTHIALLSKMYKLIILPSHIVLHLNCFKTAESYLTIYQVIRTLMHIAYTPIVFPLVRFEFQHLELMK